jgi:ABC-2 type transport system ATP-binding protein
MLNCSNLNFSYGKTPVLKNIDLSFNPAQTIGLIGSNGSSKSTLLNLLGGLLLWQKGELYFDNKNVIFNKTTTQDLRIKTGFLMQSFSSDEKITPYDNLLYTAKIYGIKKNLIAKKIEETLELANLQENALIQTKKLSIGMRRRLELYRTFMHEPQLVLLDEPTASLDSKESQKFFDFLYNYQRKHQSITIIATHKPSEALICDMVIMMHKGEIIAQDSPHKFLEKLDFVNCYASSINDTLPIILQNFDFKKLKQDNKFHAQLSLDKLANLLQNKQNWQKDLQEFSFNKPDLNDVYEHLIQNLS